MLTDPVIGSLYEFSLTTGERILGLLLSVSESKILYKENEMIYGCFIASGSNTFHVWLGNDMRNFVKIS